MKTAPLSFKNTLALDVENDCWFIVLFLAIISTVNANLVIF